VYVLQFGPAASKQKVLREVCSEMLSFCNTPESRICHTWERPGVITAEQIIEMFEMKPLKGEGGYYVETYRSGEQISRPALPSRYLNDRSFGSAILYLLTPNTFSRLHRLKSDEVFHFYLGGPVTMLQLHPDGSDEVITLGQDISASQKLQVTVPQGTWQGCLLNEPGRFALMGTTAAPAFDFKDFEPGDRETLLRKYPAQKDLILRLTTLAGVTPGHNELRPPKGQA